MVPLHIQRKASLPGYLIFFVALSFFSGLGLAFKATNTLAHSSQQQNHKLYSNQYVLLSWNDLGMHCYNRSFQYLAVLPPYNTLAAQVIQVGNPPLVVTSGITITYVFTDNTRSDNKSNFWTYAPQLFHVSLPPNVGLTGKGLRGTMDLQGDVFKATGIPLTEFRDSDLTHAYPYQLATIVVSSTITGAKLAQTTTVAPVSTEMHCNNCHYDNGDGNEGISTGVVELNILTAHDREFSSHYPPGHTGSLVSRAPILCAECHASNALNAGGLPNVPSLSNAIHSQHEEEISPDMGGCYNCHPGPQTRCLRDVMSQKFGMTCLNCHGTMNKVATNQNPWLNEPRCDNKNCHGATFSMNQPLYRNSKGHGGIYCEGCHDSPHAIAPSREHNDALKFISWQGHNGGLDMCAVCHTTLPVNASGPHNPIYLPMTFH